MTLGKLLNFSRSQLPHLKKDSNLVAYCEERISDGCKSTEIHAWYTVSANQMFTATPVSKAQEGDSQH